MAGCTNVISLNQRIFIWIHLNLYMQFHFYKYAIIKRFSFALSNHKQNNNNFLVNASFSFFLFGTLWVKMAKISIIFGVKWEWQKKTEWNQQEEITSLCRKETRETKCQRGWFRCKVSVLFIQISIIMKRKKESSGVNFNSIFTFAHTNTSYKWSVQLMW